MNALMSSVTKPFIVGNWLGSPGAFDRTGPMSAASASRAVSVPRSNRSGHTTDRLLTADEDGVHRDAPGAHRKVVGARP